MALSRFEKRRVIRAGLKIRKAGDGLSSMLKFAPIALAVGDEINVVLRGVVIDVQHPAEDRKNPSDSDLIRVHIADTTEVALVTHDEAEPMLKDASDRLAEFRLQESLAEEKAAGIHRLDLAEPEASDG